jgi:arginyl-tRNA synthetase
VEGPGFINLRLDDALLQAQLATSIADRRLGVAPAQTPRTYVIDYSSPNVAKPMHVGHIRSTVIGDALYRMLKFAGHHPISDNHLGDWGTQFGMIIYGYKHFVDRAAYASAPVAELGRLYKVVHKLVDYYETKDGLPKLQEQIQQKEAEQARLRDSPAPADKADAKKRDKSLQKATTQLQDLRQLLAAAQEKLTTLAAEHGFAALLASHPDIQQAVLAETAKLHAGDADNLRLWHEFLPACRSEIQRIYARLDVRFDHELGESFYHAELPGVVLNLQAKGLARESDGAMCVFLPQFETPMIVQKQDGAFLYATSDLATIDYRLKEWHPDAILYVVDHRQSEHFEKLFAVARLCGCEKVELQHIGFGTVLGSDGRPYKTRSGDTVGLEGLLDEAVSRAHSVVSANDDAKIGGAELSPEERNHIAESVGIGALKYADLSQNRTSDYTFSYDKMLAMNGNTATYMQYSYARVQSIFRKGDIDIQKLRASASQVRLEHPLERAIALELLRFGEVLDLALADFRPNLLTNYLFDMTQKFFTFYDQCPVLKAESETARTTRLLLCDLVGRTIQTGLELLGIKTVEKM